MEHDVVRTESAPITNITASLLALYGSSATSATAGIGRETATDKMYLWCGARSEPGDDSMCFVHKLAAHGVRRSGQTAAAFWLHLLSLHETCWGLCCDHAIDQHRACTQSCVMDSVRHHLHEHNMQRSSAFAFRCSRQHHLGSTELRVRPAECGQGNKGEDAGFVMCAQCSLFARCRTRIFDRYSMLASFRCTSHTCSAYLFLHSFVY